MARRQPQRNNAPTTVVLAGIPVRREHVAWIANELDNDPTAARLREALERDVRILGVEITERESILAALDDPPEGLTEQRATLHQEHVGRKRHGMA